MDVDDVMTFLLYLERRWVFLMKLPISLLINTCQFLADLIAGAVVYVRTYLGGAGACGSAALRCLEQRVTL